MISANYGKKLKEYLLQKEIVPFVGIYDAVSASIAAHYYDGLFLSGFSFSASHYGLPDRGFISWPDITGFVQRLRTVIPDKHILVDIDDGFGDKIVASHVVSVLESAGASGVVMEDQKRPKKCGHLDGKQILDINEYTDKLSEVLSTRKELFVIARTDAVETEEIIKRISAFSEAGADAVLVDGIKDIKLITEIRSVTEKPIVFNQIAGGKSPILSLSDLHIRGVSLVIYSTPCLFAALTSVRDVMEYMIENDGMLPDTVSGGIDLQVCKNMLDDNLLK